MSWTDQTAIETIRKLRDEFKIDTFVETGTYKGINALVQSKNFKYVKTCDINYEYLCEAKEKLNGTNVRISKQSSPEFLADFKTAYRNNHSTRIIFFYLDAHFYDPDRVNKFVVTEELAALKNFKNCVIAIHDFDNGMGHITYDGKTINMEMVRDLLKKINSNFHFYTNTNEFSNIHTLTSLRRIGLSADKDAISNIKYAWSKERLTKRGILYAVPRELDLNKFKLIKWN